MLCVVSLFFKSVFLKGFGMFWCFPWFFQPFRCFRGFLQDQLGDLDPEEAPFTSRAGFVGVWFDAWLKKIGRFCVFF